MILWDIAVLPRSFRNKYQFAPPLSLQPHPPEKRELPGAHRNHLSTKSPPPESGSRQAQTATLAGGRAGGKDCDASNRCC